MIRTRFIFLFSILLLSFLLGAGMILSGDFFYLYDQARDFLLARDVVDNHTLMLIGNRSGLGGFFHGPLWIYILAPVYFVGRGNPLVFSYFYIFLQLITVLVSYLVGSRLYGPKGGIIISFLIAFSPAVWGYVPNTVSVNIEPLVYLLLFYFLVKFWRGQLNSFIPAAFLAGLALQFETSSSLVLIPAMISIFILNKKAIKNLKLILFSIFSFTLSILTFILFDLRHKFLMTNSILRAISGGEREKGYLEFGDRFVSHVNSLAATYKGILFSQTGLLTVILAVIFIFGAILILKDKNHARRNEFIFLLLFPVLIFGIFMLYPYTVWPEYVFGLLVPVAFALFLAITSVWKNIFGKALVILFFIITFFNAIMFIQKQYFQKYPQDSSAGSYINQEQVVEWIFKDAGEGKFGYFVYTSEIFTHGMDYLISWYGKKHPDTVMESRKNKVTYLILYPHMENDKGAYDFWKKNTLKTNGSVIDSKTFRGGIIVEKLLIGENEQDVNPNYYQGLIFR